MSSKLVNVASTPIQASRVSFGKRLRHARERVGLSGAELSAKLGLKRAAVPHYETGRAFPSIPVLKELTRFLGVSVDWLLFDECEEMGQMQDKELAEYFLKADHLSSRERRAIKDFIDGVLARAELDEIKRTPSKSKKVA